MSLLQELNLDTNYLLRNTKATQEQLNEFLQITGLDLGDVLYKESKYNLFVDWLKHHEELEEYYLFVNNNMIEYLIDKKHKNQPYSKGELLNIYAYEPRENKYYTCVNINGEIELESYNTTAEIIEEINFWN